MIQLFSSLNTIIVKCNQDVGDVCASVFSSGCVHVHSYIRYVLVRKTMRSNKMSNKQLG